MIVARLANSHNDEFQTPEYAIKPLLPYLESFPKIWCPFDLETSNYVKVLKGAGHEVINTHILNGEDFFNLNIDCDAIISNPPYSCKTDILLRLFSLGKPFAMLVGMVGIFENQIRFDMFKNNTFEVMYFNRRIAYIKENNQLTNPPFASGYICSKILPKQIVFEEVHKK